MLKQYLKIQNATQKEVDNAKATLEKAINSLENTTTSVEDTVNTPVNKGDSTSVKTGCNSSLIGYATLYLQHLVNMHLQELKLKKINKKTKK